MAYREDGSLRCDMADTCAQPVTHIGEKGYIYCAGHGPARRPWERTRKLRPAELKRLKRGETIARY